jgi:amphi-Trp domain-containing protein
VPSIEIKRKATLSRQEVADRLIALGNALAKGSEVELSSGGDSIKVEVAGEVRWELEIEIDGDETEIEIELKWTDGPKSARPAPAAERAAPPAAAEPEPAAAASEPAAAQPTPARRGRPRKAAAS